MTNEPEHKPVIGDDGELMQPDLSFPQIGYAKDAIPEPALPSNARFALSVFIPFGAILVIIFFIGLAYIKPVTAPLAAQPTQFAAHKVQLRSQFHLPDAQSAIEWTTGLTHIHRLNWSRDGNRLAIEYGQNQVASLDIAAGDYIFKDLLASAFDWSPIDSHQFVAADMQHIGIYTIDATPVLEMMLKPSTKFTMPPTLIRWSIDGTQIAALSQDRRLVDIMYAADGELATEHPFEAPVWDMQWSPIMTSILAIKDSGLIYLQPANKSIPQQQGLGVVYPDSSISWKRVSYAPDGLRLVLVGWDCDLKLAVFDRARNSITWIKRMADYQTQSCNRDEAEIAWSPKTEQIATFIHGDDTVYLWNGKNGTISDRLIPLRSRPITAIAWSPDGKYLAIGSNSNVTFWSPT